MEKLVFLMDSDVSLRENIAELLELEGYHAVHMNSGQAKSFFRKYHAGLILLNMLTIDEPIEELVRFLKNKTDGIAVLCSDHQDPRINEADIKILMPFSSQGLLGQLSDFINAEDMARA